MVRRLRPAPARCARRVVLVGLGLAALAGWGPAAAADAPPARAGRSAGVATAPHQDDQWDTTTTTIGEPQPLPPVIPLDVPQDWERIERYRVDIELHEDGSVEVTEVIDYDFGSSSGRHGIERFIPVRAPWDPENPGTVVEQDLRDGGRYERVNPLDVLDVNASPEGTPDGYEILRPETGSTEMDTVRIGDADRIVDGARTYSISYRLGGVANGFEDHDELYFDAIGTGWSTFISDVEVTVTLPGDVDRIACFQGGEGAVTSCERSSLDGSTARFGTVQLAPNQGLTVVVALPKGVLDEPEPILHELWSVQRAFSPTPLNIGLALVVGGGGLALVLGLGWSVGRDRRWRGSAVDAAFGGTGDGEEAVPITGGHDAPVEFVPPDGIRPAQVVVLDTERVGSTALSATIVDLAVRGFLRIQEEPDAIDYSLVRLRQADEATLLPFERDLMSAMFGSGGFVAMSSLKTTEFQSARAKVMSAIESDSVERGWFARAPGQTRARWLGLAIVVFVLALAGGVALVALSELGLVGLALPVPAVALLVASRHMPRRTPSGTAAKSRVDGFRELFDAGEGERARFYERASIFHEYLPYAMVFGATERWVRAFAGINVPPPTYYSGHGVFDPWTFNRGISSFAASSSSVMSWSPPSSSGGSSGFSGGSSGGGGGGGGGGSW